ncbi:amidase [Aestuariispira ectoiniformans]|uniref:amidase n=1 Tax=Aestuariispira ectoiniformans TaxID=2775080 RepID=UPI00223BCCA4|nr:amidase [Aestuariispira ectoiniformans]
MGSRGDLTADIGRLNAFIDPDMELSWTREGMLAGRTCAVKDIFDIEGQVTGFGNPAWRATHGPARDTAACLERLLMDGVRLRGRAHMDELAYSLNGENFHYGTPLNPNAPGRIPGGSSSGSATAAAAGVVDFALGTDTGGSVRVPASYCGLYGLRTTHDRISRQGVIPLAQSFDTVGWFARDPDLMERVGRVLFVNWKVDDPANYELALPMDFWALADSETAAALQSGVEALQRLMGEAITFDLSGDEALEDWFMPFRVCQGREIWKNHGAWVEANNPEFGPGLGERLHWTSTITEAQWAEANALRQNIADKTNRLLKTRTVLVIPTAPGPAPEKGQDAAALESFRYRALQLTGIAGLSGVPQISLPLGKVDGCPVGLSLIAAKGCDELLLTIAARLAGAAPNGLASLRV